MKPARFHIIAGALCALMLAGCASQTTQPQSASEKDRILSGGYAQLYEASSGLQYVSKLLYVKFESDAFEKVIDDISTYAGQLTTQLEKLDKDYPSLSIDNTYLPEMEKRKRKAVQDDRIKSLAPVVGRTGVDFERTLLLTQSGALNQQRHLAQVMIAAETSEQRKTFLRGVVSNYDRLYQEDVKLLNGKYFCQPGKSGSNKSGK